MDILKMCIRDRIGPENDYAKAIQVQDGQEIVSISFRLTIDGVMDSNFASILGIELAKERCV